MALHELNQPSFLAKEVFPVLYAIKSQSLSRKALKQQKSTRSTRARMYLKVSKLGRMLEIFEK